MGCQLNQVAGPAWRPSGRGRSERACSRLVSLAVVLITLGLIGCRKPQEPGVVPEGAVTFRIRWPAGARYIERLEVVQSVEATLGGVGQGTRQNLEMSQEFGLHVLAEPPEGGRAIEMRLRALRMMVRTGDSVLVSFDSARKPVEGDAGPVAETFRHLASTPIQFALDASNQVVRVQGLEELRGKTLTNASAAVRTFMAQILSEESFKRMFHFARGLPDHPIRIGDGWPVQSEISLGPLGMMELDQEYVMKGFERREQRLCALLEITGTLKRKPDQEAAGSNLKVSVEEGTVSGRYWYDPELGMMVAGEIEQAAKINLGVSARNVAATNEPPATRTMTTKINQSIKFSIQPLTPGR